MASRLSGWTNVGAGSVVAAAALLLTGCTQKQPPVNVLLDNQSTATLEVQVDLPARGPLGRKANHEAFRMLVPPGMVWQNGRDTLRVGTEPNDRKQFRIMVADVTKDPRVWYTPFLVPGGRKHCSVTFTGAPGNLAWRVTGAEGEGEALVPYPMTGTGGESVSE
jgi:hypothetical protein